MANVDAEFLADTTVRLKLLSPQQVEEAWKELESRNVSPTEFLRCLERKGHLTPFQIAKLLRGETDGYFLGAYRLLYKIASGSFGRVYRADDPASGRVVAIKVLRKRWAEDKDTHNIDLFIREGKVGMGLRHPNIVEILAVNYEKKTNQYYIVMEFVEGGNLRDLLNIRKKLQAIDVLKIMEDTAAGLAYSFSKGITHRDLKLTNILLSAQGPAKLVDFGLAEGQTGVAEADGDITVDRTVDYAGLERSSDAPHGDPRSDLYFLGCVGFELLTGRSPLNMDRNANARMATERFLNIAPMTSAEVTAPPSLFRLIENLMALNPAQRIQTPSQLLERIRECRAELDAGNRGGKTEAKKTQPTIFLVENDETLQDLLRTKLKEKGYRVLISREPVRALDRFCQQPFDLLIVNAGSTGEDGCYVFDNIIEEARRQNLACAGVLMLNEDQTAWQKKMADHSRVATLVQPISFKQLLAAIQLVLTR